ncbi:19813_t:CDS:2, partial [Gigaspora rosea]
MNIDLIHLIPVELMETELDELYEMQQYFTFETHNEIEENLCTTIYDNQLEGVQNDEFIDNKIAHKAKSVIKNVEAIN